MAAPDDEWSSMPPAASGPAPAAPADEWAGMPPVPGAPAPSPSMPNPYYDPLSTRAPTWGETARHWGGIAAGGALYGATSPADLPGSLYNLGATEANRFGAELPMVSTPGQRAQAALGVPQPQTVGEAALSGAIQLPVSSLYGGIKPLVGGQYADVLRNLPWQVGAGAAQGAAAGLGLPPELQAVIGLGTAGAVGRYGPGAVTRASPLEVQQAQLLRSEGVPVLPADLSGGPAQGVYKATGAVPLSGAAGFTGRQQGAFADAIARRFGGTSDNGLITDGVLNQGYNRTDGLYDSLKSAQDVPLKTFGPALQQVVQDANRFDPHVAVKVGNDVNNLLLQAQAGALPAANIVDAIKSQSVISKGAMASAGKAADAAPYYQQIRDTLRTALNNNLTPPEQQTLQTANDYYRSLKTVEAARDGGTNIVTPARLAAAVKSSKYEPLGGDMDQLAQAGVRFVTPAAATGPVSAQMPSVSDILHGAPGIGAGAFGLGELAHTMGLPATGSVAAGAVGGVPLAVAVNRYSRLGALGTPAPTAAQFYSRALLTPNLYVGPQRLGQPQAPGLAGTYAPWLPQTMQAVLP